MTNSGEGGGIKMKQESWRRRKPGVLSGRERDAESTGSEGNVIWITFCSRSFDAAPQALEAGSQYKCKCRATAQTAPQGSSAGPAWPAGPSHRGRAENGKRERCAVGAGDSVSTFSGRSRATRSVAILHKHSEDGFV